MAGRRSSRRRGGGDHEEEHADERWLLTYADMITLLMALFVVMWSMGNVSPEKFDALSVSLKDAFSGQILPGGEAIILRGEAPETARASAEPPVPAIMPVKPSEERGEATRKDGAHVEQADLEKLEREIDQYVAQHGLTDTVRTDLARRGLVVRVLSDGVLFDSGSAEVKPGAEGLLDTLGRLLKAQVRNPIQVEGNTDSIPVRSGRFPTNWELSTTRATAIVRELIARKVWSGRLSATGYADRRPIATNATDGGRRQNRRVELVVLRRSAAPESATTTTNQGGMER